MSAAPMSTATPTLIVTRPESEALRWVSALREHGVNAKALPLIGIAPMQDAAALAALAAARARLADYAALMFVSPNAVAYFFDSQGFAERPVPGRAPTPLAQALGEAGVRAWSPGPGTTRALVAAGVPEACIDAPGAEAAQFDSEALWAQVGPALPAGARVLIVRGADASGHESGRAWLAGQLAAAGAQVDSVAAYRRVRPPLDMRARTLAVGGAQGDTHWWLFSSSEAVANLRAALPGLPLGRAVALVTHPRIGEAAQAAGFGRVVQARPHLGELVAALRNPA